MEEKEVLSVVESLKKQEEEKVSIKISKENKKGKGKEFFRSKESVCVIKI